jgi:hypothetical protein
VTARMGFSLRYCRRVCADGVWGPA